MKNSEKFNFNFLLKINSIVQRDKGGEFYPTINLNRKGAKVYETNII